MAKSFDIAGVPVGDEHPVFIVAELSANHAGKRDIALKTIETAAKLGANAIKIQTYTPDTLTLKSNAPHFVVKTNNEWAGRTLHDLYAEAMTPWEWHAELKACAESHGIPLFSTPFDPTAVELLEELGCAAHKIASFEIVDLPLVETVARRGKPMIISTGMASLGEIEAAVRTCRAVGNDRLALLRCVSSYPAQPEHMNLQSFGALKSFGTIVGLSDHTRDHTVAIASVALGARIIEKHFILDRAMGGPDAFFSLEPDDLKGLIAAVRATEKAMGAPRFGVSADEKASVAFRRSLFVARDVKEGETLTIDDVRSVRPAFGIAPEHLPFVLGKKASRALKMGDPLAWDMVGGPPERPAISIRAATADDSPALLAWRNDPETRKQSLQTGVVSESDHQAWLARALSSADRKLFIASSGNALVGTLRLDRMANVTDVLGSVDHRRARRAREEARERDARRARRARKSPRREDARGAHSREQRRERELVQARGVLRVRRAHVRGRAVARVRAPHRPVRQIGHPWGPQPRTVTSVATPRRCGNR
ncbi:MAG: pseudaminic acid synthase [Rubrivivax sp.]